MCGVSHANDVDQLIVHSMDRLARNAEDLLRMVRTLNEKGISVQFIKENLTFTWDKRDPMSDLLLILLGAVAQFERGLIRERQREGIALAKKAGVYKGRKPTSTPEQATSLGFAPRPRRRPSGPVNSASAGRRCTSIWLAEFGPVNTTGRAALTCQCIPGQGNRLV